MSTKLVFSSCTFSPQVTLPLFKCNLSQNQASLPLSTQNSYILSQTCSSITQPLLRLHTISASQANSPLLCIINLKSNISINIYINDQHQHKWQKNTFINNTKNIDKNNVQNVKSNTSIKYWELFFISKCQIFQVLTIFSAFLDNDWLWSDLVQKNYKILCLWFNLTNDLLNFCLQLSGLKSRLLHHHIIVCYFLNCIVNCIL